MARVWGHCREIVAACIVWAGFCASPALAQDQGPNAGTDLYDRPVLAVDPGMHTAEIWGQAVDARGEYAVTGGADRTVRVWSVADGKPLRTIWIPAGPEKVGDIYAVSISPDGRTIAAGGWTERLNTDFPIYLFDRESGALVKRIHGDLPQVVHFLTFSPDGRYLVATLGENKGIRVFDRNNDWHEAFRDDAYGRDSYGASFARDGRLATTSMDGKIRLYRYEAAAADPNFRLAREPVAAPSDHEPYRIAFSPDGKRLAVGYNGAVAVDVLDAATLARVGGHKPTDLQTPDAGSTKVAWSPDGGTLFAAGIVMDARARRFLLAWDRGGLGAERRMTYCAQDTATDVSALPDGRILMASLAPCLGVIDAHSAPIWTVEPRVLDFRYETDRLKVSPDGEVIDFGGSTGALLRFSLRSLALSTAPPNDDETFSPNRQGLAIDGWQNGRNPSVAGHPLPLHPYDFVRSLAIAADAKGLFLGSAFGLAAFDDTGTQKWRRATTDEVWAVNASQDGRVACNRRGRDDPLATRQRRTRVARAPGPAQQERLGAVDARRLLSGDRRRSGCAQVGDQPGRITRRPRPPFRKCLTCTGRMRCAS